MMFDHYVYRGLLPYQSIIFKEQEEEYGNQRKRQKLGKIQQN